MSKTAEFWCRCQNLTWRSIGGCQKMVQTILWSRQEKLPSTSSSMWKPLYALHWASCLIWRPYVKILTPASKKLIPPCPCENSNSRSPRHSKMQEEIIAVFLCCFVWGFTPTRSPTLHTCFVSKNGKLLPFFFKIIVSGYVFAGREEYKTNWSSKSKVAPYHEWVFRDLLASISFPRFCVELVCFVLFLFCYFFSNRVPRKARQNESAAESRLSRLS